MSPTRRDIIKAAGGVAALIALPQACAPIDPAIAAESFSMEYLFVGARLGTTFYSLLGTPDRPAELTAYVTLDGVCYPIRDTLSPKGQRIWESCLAQMATVFAMEANEEGWE